MSNSVKDIHVFIQPYLDDCPPWDIEIDDTLLPEIAQEVFSRFDFMPIYDQIDRLACQILRERGIEPCPAEAGVEPDA
jgi:hypothetical protein